MDQILKQDGVSLTSPAARAEPMPGPAGQAHAPASTVAIFRVASISTLVRGSTPPTRRPFAYDPALCLIQPQRCCLPSMASRDARDGQPGGENETVYFDA